ncbi:MAG: DUF2079 domain-containing protein [Pseudomonadota bacterium]
MAIFFGFAVRVNIERLSNFSFKGRDLAIFCQSLNSAGHGGLLRNSMELHGLKLGGSEEKIPGFLSLGGISHLGVHWSPILFVLAPVYRIAANPLTLQILQSLLLALSVLPVFFFARRLLGGSQIAFLVGLAFLMQPLTMILATDSFRENAVAVPILGLLFYSGLCNKTRMFVLALLAAVLIKEDVAGIAFLFGFGLLVNRRKRLGAMSIIASSVALFLCILALHFFRDGVPSDHLLFYKQFGSGFVEIAANIFGNPILALEVAWSKMEHQCLMHLLGPWLFLPLVSPFSLLGLPIVLINLLSSQPYQHDAVNYSNLLLIPILAFAAVDGLSRVRQWVEKLAAKKLEQKAWVKAQGTLVVAIVIGWFVASGLVFHQLLPGVKRVQRSSLSREEREGARQMMNQIPKLASVMASHLFLPELANRKELFSPWNVPKFRPDYVLIHSQAASNWPHRNSGDRDQFVLGLVKNEYSSQRIGRVFLFKRGGLDRATDP